MPLFKFIVVVEEQARNHFLPLEELEGPFI
jgi:hypothetical protein